MTPQLVCLLATLPAPLPNGLRVVEVPRPGPAWVELAMSLPLGHSHDPADKTGMALLLAQLLERELGPRFAVTLNASTLEVRSGATPQELQSALRTLNRGVEALLNPKAPLEPPRKVAIQLRLLAQQDPRALALAGVQRSLQEARPTLGDQSALRSIARKDVEKHTRSRLCAGRITIGLAGALPSARPHKAWLGSWKRRPACKPSKSTPAEGKPRALMLIDLPGAERAQLVWARAAPPSDRAAALARQAIAGGLRSALNRALTPLSTGPALATLTPGRFMIRLSVPNAKARGAIQEAQRVLKSIQKNGLQAEDIARARALSAGLANKDALSALEAAMHPPPEQTEVTDAQISNAAKKLTSLQTFVVVGDASGELKSALVPLGEVSIVGYDQL